MASVDEPSAGGLVERRVPLAVEVFAKVHA